MNQDTMLESGFSTHHIGYVRAFEQVREAAALPAGWYLTSKGQRTGGPADPEAVEDTIRLLELCARRGLPAPRICPIPEHLSMCGLLVDFDDLHSTDELFQLEWSPLAQPRWLVWSSMIGDVPRSSAARAVYLARLFLARHGG